MKLPVRLNPALEHWHALDRASYHLDVKLTSVIGLRWRAGMVALYVEGSLEWRYPTRLGS